MRFRTEACKITDDPGQRSPATVARGIEQHQECSPERRVYSVDERNGCQQQHLYVSSNETGHDSTHSGSDSFDSPGNEDIPLPSYQSADSAAMDLHAAVPDPVQIPPGNRRSLVAAFLWQFPTGFEGQVRPRSGLAAKHSLLIPNSPGTIDADYRGEVKVILLNLGKSLFRRSESDADCTISDRPGASRRMDRTIRPTSYDAGRRRVRSHG